MALPKEYSEVESTLTRRRALRSIMGLSLATLSLTSYDTKSAYALDMDAFINSEVNLFSLLFSGTTFFFQHLTP